MPYKEKHKCRLRAKGYYRANKEKLNAKSKAYNKANKEKIKVKQKVYYEAHKEKIAAAIQKAQDAAAQQAQVPQQ